MDSSYFHSMGPRWRWRSPRGEEKFRIYLFDRMALASTAPLAQTTPMIDLIAFSKIHMR
jgi:hypothetical protein